MVAVYVMIHYHIPA